MNAHRAGTSALAARRGRPGFGALPARLAWAGLLLALAAPFAAPAQAQMSPSVLLSNLSESDDVGATVGAIANLKFTQAIGFTTGSNESGYTLTSVKVILSSFEADDGRIRIFSESGGNPGSSVHVLQNPSGSSGTLTFTAQANAILDKDTKYFVVLDTVSRSTERYSVRLTNSDSLTSMAAGWSLDANRLAKNSDSGNWSSGTDVPLIEINGAPVNSAPTVANAIPDRAVTAGTAFSYTFPANTFDDVDDSTLTYTAELDGGGNLPSWLTFNAGTRTFSGTPQSADVGTVPVKVTASDDDGASVSDTFVITVSAVASNPATLESPDAYFVNGALRYGFDLRLTQGVHIPYEEMRDHAFRVTNGFMVGAQRIHKERTDGVLYSNHWRLRVAPDDETKPVTVTLRGNRPCGEAGALCGPDGGRVDNSPSLTLSTRTTPPDLGSLPSLSIADASGTEDSSVLVFDVSLSKAVSATIAVDFRTVSGGSATRNTDYQEANYRIVFPAGETVAPGSVGLIEDSIDDAGETVKVEITNARLTTPRGKEFGPLTIARGQATGTINAPTNSKTPLPNVEMRIKNARASESGGWLRFTITLSRALDENVCYDFETLTTGTADVDVDFAQRPNSTLWQPAGITEWTEFVRILDDSIDDSGETVKVRISNAELCDDASKTITISRPEATGTITNSDPIPKAWLSRFGRAASDASIEAIGRRLKDNTPTNHLTLGGGGLDRLRSLTGALRGSPPDTAAPDSPFGDMNAWERMDRLSGKTAGLDRDAHGDETGVAAGPSSADAGPGSSAPDPSAGGLEPPRPEGATRSGLKDFARLLGVPDPRELLMGSSYFYSPGVGGAGPDWLGSWSAWGETSTQRFRGADGPLNVNGELATATFGFDTRRDRWLAGLALSYTEGEGAYARRGAAAGGGELSSSLASLNPYLRYELNGRTEVWGVLGVGAGNLSLAPVRAETALRTDLSHAMAAFGGRTALVVRAGDAGSFKLALRTDARFTETASDTVAGLMGATGATGRVRVLLEGSGSIRLASGGALEPSLEAGLRYDGGDAETGAGLEVGGGLGYTTGRLNVRFDARVLVAHEDADYEEWGFSGSVTYTPRQDGRGLNLELGSSWGDTQSGVKALWSRDIARGLVRGAPTNAGQRFHADIGYGLEGRRGRALWTPYVGAQGATGTDARTLRLGVKLTSGTHAQAELEIGQEANARGQAGPALSLGGSVRF